MKGGILFPKRKRVAYRTTGDSRRECDAPKTLQQQAAVLRRPIRFEDDLRLSNDLLFGRGGEDVTWGIEKEWILKGNARNKKQVWYRSNQRS
jgi:hypothetical protein